MMVTEKNYPKGDLVVVRVFIIIITTNKSHPKRDKMSNKTFSIVSLWIFIYLFLFEKLPERNRYINDPKRNGRKSFIEHF